MLTTGLDAFTRATQTFPAKARAARQAAIKPSVARVAADARARLDQQTKGTGRTSASIGVVETAAGAMLVARPVSGRHPNVVLFLEFGTRKMPARPFFFPAVDAGRSAHHRAVEAANDAAIVDAFGG